MLKADIIKGLFYRHFEKIIINISTKISPNDIFGEINYINTELSTS